MPPPVLLPWNSISSMLLASRASRMVPWRSDIIALVVPDSSASRRVPSSGIGRNEIESRYGNWSPSAVVYQ
jgi:hypothetical protein